MKKDDCIFCKIGKRKIPSDRVFENKNFLAFLDIKPVSFGHTLIIPKKHIVWMQEADDKTISEIFKLTKKLMLTIKRGLGCDYVQVSIVGNEVSHFHVHLIPRYNGDNFRNFPTKIYKKGEAEKTLRKLTREL